MQIYTAKCLKNLKGHIYKENKKLKAQGKNKC